ncbi:L,D-transpeptidase [Prosthecomicrobium pneumaticum]|uniref:Lipoprotein-anchoring transpeptidase ErfK/SrfK n=1 Tax=Prosthecomicrobium pneumaticum TaxID=81895 RepID=A0A7W9CUG5_9HYPH|nr:L,D-transpeptidase [Prosthecomicrobium pneumaticum]MBB5752145.1 lipoprotein-anchoring transpeptidase ErfK/SrfK [Prosthecomicrobium pneumaticum]
MTTRRQFLSIAALAATLTATGRPARAEGFFEALFFGGGGLEPGLGPNPLVGSPFARRRVRFDGAETPGTIVIETGPKYLYFVEGNGRATRYGIGVGREGFGWRGTVQIGRKAEWPDWIPPEEMRVRELRRGRRLPVRMAGGPDNPLGARALYLYRGGRDTLYRIHGTNEPQTIGRNVSSGCIRMVNADVVHLYGRAEIGAKVIVR